MSFGRCSMCPNTHRQVGPDGPRNARIMLIGEGPGAHEDRTGIPFYGPSGDELNDTYLKLARLDRSDIYVTNCVQCRCERGGFDIKPAQALIDCCTRNHLHEEISDVSPAIIILAGAAACSLAPDVDLELDHGRIFSVRDVPGLGGWSGQILPVYHPAAGMRDGKFMISMLDDWERFGKWLRGLFVFPEHGEETPIYKLAETAEDVYSYFSGVL